MTIWKISNIEFLPEYNGAKNVVTSIQIVVSGALEYSRKVGIDYSNVGQKEFIDFNNLTEDQLIQWAKNSLGDSGVCMCENMANLKQDFRTELPWKVTIENQQPVEVANGN